MERVTWSDNICSVGWTCIHGYFTPSDLEWLLKQVPKGHLTPTYYSQLPIRWTPETVRERWGNDPRSYYFSFPEAEGTTLLVALRIRGFPLQRGQHAA